MLPAGTTLGGYRILAPLGSGGMGVVYRARDERLGRDVALKVLPTELGRDPARRRRFEQESRAASVLNHPHVVSVHDIGEHDGQPFLVTELLEGETLRERLRAGPIPVRRALEIARQVAMGLAAAHEKGIVHRDLKPENVFLVRGGLAKVLDFGLARVVEPMDVDSQARTPDVIAPSSPTRPGTVLGTVGYMSPEQVRGEQVDHRTDVFALGVVLHEMLAGERPFRGETSVETMAAILKEEPPALSALRPDVPPALEAIVRHCLEKRPENRFQAVRDLAFQLETVSGTSLDAATTRVRPGGRRWRRALLVASAAILVLAACGVTAWRLGRVEERRASVRARSAVSYTQLTFRRGNVLHARFAPDGQIVVYGAAFDGRPTEVFLTRPGSPESLPLGLPECDLLAVARTGELAICRRGPFAFSTAGRGVLARVPLAGGSPRDVAADVLEADWSPNGELAVVRVLPEGQVIELPWGSRTHAGGSWSWLPRVSPDGAAVAFADGSDIRIAWRDGKSSRLPLDVAAIHGLAWAPDGDRLWYSGVASANVIGTVDLDGSLHRVASFGYHVVLHDVARDGRLLVEHEMDANEVACETGAGPSRNLSWFDRGTVRALSADGSTFLINDSGPGRFYGGAAYVRGTDGRPASRVAGLIASDMTPDGRFVAVPLPERGGFRVIPVGAGEERTYDIGDLRLASGPAFAPDGSRAYFIADAGDARRLYELALEDGELRALTPADLELADALRVSTDGRHVLVMTAEAVLLVPLDGGEPRGVSGVTRDDALVLVTQDAIFVSDRTRLPPVIDRVDLVTLERTPWRTLHPPDAVGAFRVGDVVLTPDLATTCYSYQRISFSALFVVEGME